MKIPKSKTENTMEVIKMLQDGTKTNPFAYEQKSVTNTLLQDMAVSLAVIADWCLKDMENKQCQESQSQ